MQLPSWVEHEIWNWSRWCWEGEHPGPRRMLDEPTACEFPPPAGWEEDIKDDVPINYDRAKKVQAIYDRLCLVEQRIVQSEYTRVNEYGNLPAHLRREKVCRQLKIKRLYLLLVLMDFRKRVMREFR